MDSVLITGAGRGLGRALTGAFLSSGWHVYALVRNPAHVDELRAEGDNKCTVIVGDVTTHSVVGAIHDTLASGLRLDVLINNAGIAGSGSTIDMASENEIEALLAVHCLAALRITKAAWPYLSPCATIINISSRFGSVTKAASGELDSIECSYAYRIAKAAQNMLTLCISKDLAGSSRKACAIHPGQLTTETASTDADRDPREAAEKLIALLPQFQNGKCYSLFDGQMNW